jgi:DNA-binding transcriptional LysR family regulator
MEQYPNIENLSLFIKVVEAGSFAKVCRQTHIPKASLSRKITQLEEHYGSQLLIRNTRHLQLTEIGKDILNKAHAIISLVEDTQASVQKTKVTPHGLLRITAGVEYGLSVVSPIVNSYLKKFPDVNIELDLTGRRVDLIYENFDLGIRIGPLEDSSLSARKIGSFKYGLLCSPKFLNEHKPLTIDKLSRVPSMGFSRINKNNQWTLFNKIEERTVDIQPRLTSNNYWSLLNAARESLGLVYMPLFLAQTEIERGQLVHVMPNWSSEEISIHFIYPSQKYLNSKVRSFIDFTIEELKRN